MEQSNINPLPKVDTPTQYVDFRGINVTPVIARCFEKTVYNHFSKKAFEENLASNQYAYRDGCNCTDVLIDIENNYLKALDDKDCTCVRILLWTFLSVDVYITSTCSVLVEIVKSSISVL